MDTTPSSTPDFQTIARLADLTQTTHGYQGPVLVAEAVACWYALAAMRDDLAAMAARVAKLERRTQEREAWLLGHISEEEHMRFVERFQ